GPSEALAPAAPAPGGTPPSGPPLGTPARQVAEAVAAELARPSATAGAAATTPGGEGPLRLLTIQLRPMDLGTVLVRMRLRDGQLEMSLHASRAETAALLRQDGALLADLLRQSGYQPDGVTIGANEAGGAPQGDGGRQNSGAPFQAGGQAGGHTHAGANPDQASRRPGDPSADDRTDLTSERTHETNASGPDRSGLYL
ncbi:MAG: flagellar hook-length control protein FliK, partial [Methylobacterium sp.]|uniref:flagellar hook-length control protein FliK n=2 Tax=unclassified Methylobacterium TaxID=2615210 RepID=UPI00271B3683